MSGVCGDISAGLSFDCDNPLQSGAEDRLILMNREDYLNATITVDPSNSQIITDIVLPVGKLAYVYQGKNNSNVPKYEMIKQAFAEVYNHEINFKAFQVDPTAKKELENLAKASVVAIVENKFKGSSGNSAFEVYGAGAGLNATQILRELQNADTQGAFDCIIKSDENSYEPNMPKTLWNTDYATTKAIVDALLS